MTGEKKTNLEVKLPEKPNWTGHLQIDMAEPHWKRKDIDISLSFILEEVGLMQTTEDQTCQTKYISKYS